MKISHKRHLSRACALALGNVRRGRGGPFGAVIVSRGRVIAKGVNGVTALNDPTAHAEISAIRMACRKRKNFSLEDCVIYSSCEPCPMCLAAIYWARLDAVYFANTQDEAARIGFDDRTLYRELAKPSGRRKLRMKKLRVKDRLGAFRAWEIFENRVEY